MAVVPKASKKELICALLFIGKKSLQMGNRLISCFMNSLKEYLQKNTMQTCFNGKAFAVESKLKMTFQV